MDFIDEIGLAGDCPTPPSLVFSKTSDFRSGSLKPQTAVISNIIPQSKKSISEILERQNPEFPTELQKALLDFVIAYQLEKPNDMIGYAVSHFKQLQESRRKRSIKKAASRRESSGSTYNSVDVRRTSDRSLRRASVFSDITFDVVGSDAESSESSIGSVVIPKSDAQRQALFKIIKNCIIFNNLEPEELLIVVNSLFEKRVQAGDIVIREGDEGDQFFIIETGTYDVYIGSNQVSTLNNGTFGEMALLYNVVRSATVQASTDGTLWVMDRETFRKILHKHEMAKQVKYKSLLRSVTVFKALDNYEITNLVDALETKYYEKGDVIIYQGEEPAGMFFIVRGEVSTYDDRRDGRGNVIVSKLTTGQFFGDLALMTKHQYRFSVQANNKVKCVFVNKEAFEHFLPKCFPEMIKYNFDKFGVSLDDDVIFKLHTMLKELQNRNTHQQYASI